MPRRYPPFSVIKFLSLLILTVPFVMCWQMYYIGRIHAAGSRRVTVMIILFFLVALYYFARELDSFRVSIVQIRDVAFSLIIACMVTDVLLYIVIWMLAVHIPHLWPGLLCWAGQTVLSALCASAMHKAYFAVHSPLRTMLIYDERDDVEELLKADGLEKRFALARTAHISEICPAAPVELADYDAVFLCGVHSWDRNLILKYCVANGIKAYMIPRISDAIMRNSEPLHMLHLPVLKNQRANLMPEYRLLKRAMDLVISGIALVILSPLMAAVALAVKSDGGPALYKQDRLTQNGRVFKVLKFRSMCVDAEKYTGAVWSAGEDDPRITRVGRVIRACRMDELPQLINIFRGDMSIVGPRPERPELAAQIEKELPEFSLRLQVKAGLTGYAQVYGKYNTTPHDKLIMDLLYIANQSILQDLVIMLATVKILFDKESTEGVGAGEKIASPKAKQ